MPFPIIPAQILRIITEKFVKIYISIICHSIVKKRVFRHVRDIESNALKPNKSAMVLYTVWTDLMNLIVHKRKKN